MRLRDEGGTMEDFNDLKLRWEEAWRARKDAEQIPGTLTLSWYEERNKARQRERELRSALLQQGPEGKAYVRQRIYSHLRKECGDLEFILERLEKYAVPNVIRAYAEKEGKSENEVRFEVHRSLQGSYEELERLKEQLREIEDP